MILKALPVLFYTDMNVEDKTDILMRCREALDAIDKLLKSFKGSNSNSMSTPLKDRITELLLKKQRPTINNAATQLPSNTSFQDRIAWAFSKKKRIGELVSQFEQCKSALGSLSLMNCCISHFQSVANSLVCK